MSKDNDMPKPGRQATRLLAAGAHALAGQTYGDRPYSHHINEVAAVLRSYGFKDGAMQRAAYLHDILEDTEWTSEMLLEMGYYPEIVEAVEFCTDAEGHNRKTRKANTYKRVREALDAEDRPAGVHIGVMVKWADRIANLRSCVRYGNKGLLKMYRKEADTFRETYLPKSSPKQFDRLLTEYDRLVAR